MDKISYSLATKAVKSLLTKANIKGSSVLVPHGDTLSRPTLTASEVAIRYNTDTLGAELWDGESWVNLSADITVVNLKGTDTEANILSIADADRGDLWVASGTLDAWVYNGTDWVNIGPLQGPQGVGITSVVRTDGNGDQGTVDTYTITFSDLTTTTFQVTNGADGLSAYEVAVNNGFIGTELQWLESLEGVDGSDGISIDHVSKVSGTGAPGSTDTYEAWLDVEETISAGTFTVLNGQSVDHVSKTDGTGEAGTTDTYTVWGDADKTIALGTFAVYNGAESIINHITKTGTVDTTDTYTIYADADETQPLGSFETYNGVDGMSAYEVAVNNGFVGTEVQWLTTLEGQDGVDGKSITSITFTATTDASGLPAQSGATDTYTTSYSDATTSTHDVYNGVDGKEITSVVFTSTTDSSGLATQSGAVDTYTITYTDTTTDVINVYNGLDSEVVGLGDLVDVDITTVAPEDGQVLIFNQGLNKWVPGTVASTGGVGIIAPTIASPTNNAVDVVVGPTITTSAYKTTESFAGEQTSAILEIATDVKFDNVVFSAAGGTTSFMVSGLPDNTLLYARAKHVSGSFSSLWGPISRFTTMDVVVAQPVVSVSGSPDSITRIPTISGSTFGVTGGTDIHASTSWKVVRTSDSVVVWESLLDNVNLTTIQVPAGNLEIGEEYSFECQYHSTQYGSSTFGSYVGTVATLFVNKPVLTVEGAPASVEKAPLLSTNVFSTNLESGTHVSTTWVVKQAGVVVWSSVADTTNLLSIRMPSDVLEVRTEYTFEVYHTGASLGDSLTDTVTAETVVKFAVPYGLVWDNVNDTYTRTGDAVGWSTGADFTNNSTVQSKMKRCVLNSDGTVNYYLDPTNSNLKADGSASDLTGADGNVMVEIPKFWVKYENTEGAKSMSISIAPAPEYVLHPAFIKNGVEVDYRYYRAYKGSVNSSKLISRSGIRAVGSRTIAEFRTLARSNGTGWGLVDWYLLFAVQTLLFVEIGTFDSQAVLGNGSNTGNVYGMTTGGSNSIGNASSPSRNDATWMSYRGIENFYADIWEWIDGINVSSRVVYISNTQSTFASDVFTGAYTSTGVTLPSSGYIKNMDFSANGFIPTVIGGSSATFVPDYVFSDAGAQGVSFGGGAGTGLYCGAACLGANSASSSSYATVGAGLSF